MDEFILKMKILDDAVPSDDFIRQLDDTKDEAARVRLVYQSSEPLQTFTIPSAKDARASTEKRNLGDFYFAKDDYELSLACYNVAISLAPPSSEELKLAFAYRSAALIALDKCDSCLKDVERVLAMGCGARLRKQMEELKELAKRPIPLNQDEIDDEAVPCAPLRSMNEIFPCASDALEVRYSTRWGRHVVAKRDIAVGETLVYEKPYDSYLSTHQRLRRCYECFSICDAMIPCEGCSRAMYCDEKCRSFSLELHKLECPLMTMLEMMSITKIERFALHVALRAYSEASSWEQLRSTVEFCETRLPKNIIVSDLDSYASVYTLETNVDKLSGLTVFERCTKAASMLRLLKNHPTLFADVDDERDEDEDSNFWFFGGLILHNIMIIETNSHSLTTNLKRDNVYSNETTEIGCNLNPFLSFFNHSCASNVTRVSKGKINVALAHRPITKGQQLFDSYGPVFTSDEKDVRQLRLKSQYFFDCRCEACENSWPLFKCLKPAQAEILQDENFRRIDRETIKKIINGDKIEALKLIPVIYKNVAILDSHAPCREWIENEFAIIRCWRLFGNVN